LLQTLEEMSTGWKKDETKRQCKGKMLHELNLYASGISWVLESQDNVQNLKVS
jgi:hypothetical protein